MITATLLIAGFIGSLAAEAPTVFWCAVLIALVVNSL